MAATRRQAREWAIQMLTAADLNPPDDVRLFIDSFWEEIASLDDEEGRADPRGEAREFAEARVEGVLAKKHIEGLKRQALGVACSQLGVLARQL